MKRKSATNFQCPSAQALDKVGDWWSILLIRDAFQGLSRFDEFEESLGIAPNMLSRRLLKLTEAGVFQKRRYSERPPRYEYVLTPMGQEFFPVLVSLFEWGNKFLTDDQVAMRLGSIEDGEERRPVVIDKRTSEPMTPENTVLLAGPAANEITMRRVALVKSIRTPAALAHQKD